VAVGGHGLRVREREGRRMAAKGVLGVLCLMECRPGEARTVLVAWRWLPGSGLRSLVRLKANCCSVVSGSPTHVAHAQACEGVACAPAIAHRCCQHGPEMPVLAHT